MHITSVADPGCLSQIPDPEFIHPGSRIPNPTTAPKEDGEIYFFLHFFVATNIITLYWDPVTYPEILRHVKEYK